MGFQVRYSQRHPQRHLRTTTPLFLLYHYRVRLTLPHSVKYAYACASFRFFYPNPPPCMLPSVILTSLTNHWLAFDRKPDIHAAKPAQNKLSQLGIIMDLHRSARKEKKKNPYIRTADQSGSFASQHTHSHSGMGVFFLYTIEF